MTLYIFNANTPIHSPTIITALKGKTKFNANTLTRRIPNVSNYTIIYFIKINIIIITISNNNRKIFFTKDERVSHHDHHARPFIIHYPLKIFYIFFHLNQMRSINNFYFTNFHALFKHLIFPSYLDSTIYIKILYYKWKTDDSFSRTSSIRTIILSIWEPLFLAHVSLSEHALGNETRRIPSDIIRNINKSSPAKGYLYLQVGGQGAPLSKWAPPTPPPCSAKAPNFFPERKSTFQY